MAPMATSRRLFQQFLAVLLQPEAHASLLADTSEKSTLRMLGSQDIGGSRNVGTVPLHVLSPAGKGDGGAPAVVEKGGVDEAAGPRLNVFEINPLAGVRDRSVGGTGER